MIKSNSGKFWISLNKDGKIDYLITRKGTP